MAGLLKFLGAALKSSAKPTPKIRTTPRPNSTVMRSSDPIGALRDNGDIFGGLVFCATMQPRIPLRVLSRHGEVFSAPRGKPPVIAKSLHEGNWIPVLHGQKSFYGSMSSSVGPIPANGGEFLRFLVAVRQIVEAASPVDDRIRVLSAELGRPQWANFVEKLEPVPGDLVRQFFPRAVDTIPGMPQHAKDALDAVGMDTANKVAAASDQQLLAIKGIGRAKLESIRKWQKSKFDRDATRLDCVER